LDIHTGEVMAMASQPSFDLNDFIPFISNEKYRELREDPGTPLFGRAFQGEYPPASTFKPIVAATALSNGDVHEFSLIDCPEKIQIGNKVFHNWSDEPEGFIDVKRAIARSCNPWFYQVGIETGPQAFLSLARRLGFGSKTGIPLIGENGGLIPSDEWMIKHHKRKILDGDTANLSIGQGAMLATPLQVAQGMAGLANGGALPKLHLIKQVQSVNGRVLVSKEPERRNFLHLDETAVDVVHEGMMQVVHADYGTGRRARLSYTVLCGKTGTAQWGPEELEQRLAWFAGFFPLENPRYAFAALYEGKPGEKLSGGRKAAPMVSAFFEHFKEDIKKSITPPPKAMVIEDEEGFDVQELDEGAVPRAILVEDEDQGIVPLGEDPRPLRAIPVEDDEAFFIDEVPLNADGRRPLRAVPVEEDE
ncbi:MAG: penicillin-binding transpeptidase domain-containing protein, partial [Akkermansiaceae bacterium]